MKKPFYVTLVITFCCALQFLHAQRTENGWAIQYSQPTVFIENKTQFDGFNNIPGSKIIYGADMGFVKVFFTKEGLTYRLAEKRIPSKEEREERENEMVQAHAQGKQLTHKELEDEGNRLEHEIDFVQMKWLNANPQLEIVAIGKASHYYNYSIGQTSMEGVSAFEKIVYKNLYPNIDVEYIFNENRKLEYNFILHPGANAADIKMAYSDVKGMRLDVDNNLHLPTHYGDIVEHAPQTFYDDKTPIASKFVLNGRTASFQLSNYDKNREVIIDPWVQTPNSPNTQWDCLWECEKDGAGNVYAIGGTSNMQLFKYNSAGALQWTYDTQYDTTSWLGTFATDNAGNSYVTLGSVAEIRKVNTNGGLVWNNANPGGIFTSTEFWNISFNCDETKLVIGGTGNVLPPLPYIYQVDMNSGNVTSSVQITGGALFPTQEVRSITACGNGKYYFLTHDSIGYINQNFSVCGNAQEAIYYTANGNPLGYKCENWRYNNTGIEAIKSYGAFVYTHKGNQLQKRAFATGNVVASVAIPGGAFTTQFGGSFVENSGLDIDNCGNIYVGSKGSVVKFDQNLQQLAVYNTQNSFNVYDVQVSTSGDIIACGSTGTSSSGARTGYIQSFAASACAPTAITCCDASVCEEGPFCTTAPALNLTASTPGGVWSGPGITNASTGQFNPAVAGVGVHWIKNTLACGSDSIAIVVSACAPLSACSNTNGSITASNGVGVYTWAQQVQTQDCSACFPAAPPIIQPCSVPPGCAVNVTTWQNFATGATVTPTTFPVRVTDESGTQLIINSLASLQPCTACALTANASSTPSGCSPSGSATANVTAGTGPYTYAWSNGGNTQTISNLGAGSYTVTITGSGGCTATASATVGSNGSLIQLNTSSTAAGCSATGSATVSVSSGTGPFTYSWSNGATTATASNLSGGNYTVTVTGAGGCSSTASVNVTSTSGISLNTNGTATSCGQNNGSATVSTTAGTGPFTYTWSNNATTQNISNLAAGNYTVTVSGAGGCTATANYSVASSTPVSVSIVSTQPGCNPTGSATASATGNGPFTFLWSNGATTASISNLNAGTYTVTVTGANNCTGSQSATLTNATAALNATFSVTQPSCGLSNGTITCLGISGGAQPYNVVWTNNGQNIGTTYSIANLDSGVYFFSGTDQNGCKKDTSFTLNPSGAGSVTVSANKSQMCSGDSAQICAPAGYASYLWNTGQSTQCIVTKLAGNYRVTVTDAGGCTATSPNQSIGVYPLPPVSVSVNGNVLTSFNATSYQWYFNGNAIPGATSSTYVATSSGSYYVVITDQNGCRAQSNSVELSVTGIEAIAPDEFDVFPNPLASEGAWNLMTGKSWLGASVRVYDAAGKLVFETVVIDSKTSVKFDAAQGMYVLELKNGNKRIEEKLVKL